MDENKVTQTVIANILRLMAAQNPPWNRAELGRRLDISLPNVTRLLLGTHSPSVETAGKIATAFAVPIAELFAEPMPPEPGRPMGKRK